MTSQSPQLQPVTAAAYIDAISLHVSSVCVITTGVGSDRYGLTATAVSSVSAEPPRLLVCVNKSGLTHQKIMEAGHFCVNVLGEDQDDVAKTFAGMGSPPEERFSIGSWSKLSTGSPVLDDAVTAMDCRLVQTSDQSTHSVLFGEVVATPEPKLRDTLLYGGRRFRQLRKIFAASGEDDLEYL